MAKMKKETRKKILAVALIVWLTLTTAISLITISIMIFYPAEDCYEKDTVECYEKGYWDEWQDKHDCYDKGYWDNYNCYKKYS